MRRVTHKLFLLREGAAHPLQQQVQLQDQGADLVGQPLYIDGRQVLGLACRHLRTGTLDRPQGPTDHAPHNQHQQRRRRRDGGDGAQREFTCHVLAHGHVLRHLNHLEGGGQRVHAVCGAFHSRIGKAQHDLVGQGAAGTGIEDAQAVRRPYLDDQVIGHGCRGAPALRGAGAEQAVARAQRQRGALQQRIENVVGLGQRAAIGDRALRQRADHDGGQ
ncbi:hypothetical protein D3C71_1191400 [compost metagenome]